MLLDLSFYFLWILGILFVMGIFLRRQKSLFDKPQVIPVKIISKDRT